MADDDGGSPGFLGVEVITSSESVNSSESSGESSKGGTLFFSAACIPNAHKPQAPHFASLTMRVDRGHHCLVVGGTAARRAAVFKALLGTQALGGGLAGVVSPGAGLSPSGALIHVSSRPYVKPGSSLWDALIFPHDKTQSLKRGVGERQLAAVLRRLDFGFLLARAADDWGRVVDWAKVLGAGELYALALARLVYHSPPFALLDDPACLRADQLRQLFAIARRHHVTLVVASAAPDPFDPARRGAPPVECLAEFTRALRLAEGDDGGSGWAFCGFGYAPQRAAFGCDEPCDFVWADADADTLPQSSANSAAASAADLRLRRRVSALSQCSTTERRWLTTTQAAEPADASRRQSRVVSPTLTARSSLSDINADCSIGRALSARAAMLLLPATPTSDCADSCEPPGSSSSATPSHPSSRASSAAHSSSRTSDYEPPSGKSEPLAAKSESLDPLVVPISALPVAVSVSETEPVFSPAKNPYARPKNVQRSRPSLSLFSAAKQQPPPSPAADVNQRPFSRNGEEGDDQSAEAKDEGAKAAAGIATPITPITPTTAFAAAPAAKTRQVSATMAPPPSVGSAAASSTPSRIPRPPSSVSRVDRTSQQIDSSSVTSLMATLSITNGGGGPIMATTTTKLSTAGDADQLTLDEFAAALNNM
ncbi:ATP-binding cassette sub- D member 3 [Coemansia sp. RSA 2424]|nr:ATP-binding cassette sub- D member 3 [Coemansia sp. RSA 2424]